MLKSGHADLPLHGGRVPQWLAQRMTAIGESVVEAVILEYGTDEVLRRLSDPFWFQSLGCLMGMDWHSSGITTSVMGALKRAVNPRAKELGLWICGGRGKSSRKTPAELTEISMSQGFDGDSLVRCSRLTARVDNNAVQDGFQLYLHSFIVSASGNWTVVQQGMNQDARLARRYHWHSENIKSFVEEPHTFIYGKNMGRILNLTDTEAAAARTSITDMTKQNPDRILSEIRKLSMPVRHSIISSDVNEKRLGAVLAAAWASPPENFEDLLLTKGLGPRTMQALALAGEVIYGTPVRFTDPARFSMAHGGKDGHPFPVKTVTYDETIDFLKDAVSRARLGNDDKKQALKNLHKAVLFIEESSRPAADFGRFMARELEMSDLYGGRTAGSRTGSGRIPEQEEDLQLKLF